MSTMARLKDYSKLLVGFFKLGEKKGQKGLRAHTTTYLTLVLFQSVNRKRSLRVQICMRLQKSFALITYITNQLRNLGPACFKVELLVLAISTGGGSRHGNKVALEYICKVESRTYLISLSSLISWLEYSKSAPASPEYLSPIVPRPLGMLNKIILCGPIIQYTDTTYRQKKKKKR